MMSWRSGTISATLEKETYREKLSDLVQESKFMHLSEREAAQLYGEVMAKLMTLQGKVREWVEERKRIKDHDKVTCRNQWEFSSFHKPDKRAEARRVRQRNQNGWRAPLNQPYAQLGSAVNDPLSRNHNVHTSLGKYPPKKEGLTEAEQLAASGKIQILKLGEPYTGTVMKFGLAHFVVRHSDPKGRLIITVTNREGSDADIFICAGDKEPNLTTYQWSSVGHGNDRIVIKPDDETFHPSQSVVDDFRIAVYGGGSTTNECGFTLTASSFRPLAKNMEIGEVWSNMEAIRSERRFAMERRNAEKRRLRCKTGQPAAVLMAERENPEESTAVLTPARRLQALLRLRQLALLQLNAYLPHLGLLPPPPPVSNISRSTSGVRKSSMAGSQRQISGEALAGPPACDSPAAADAPAATLPMAMTTTSSLGTDGGAMAAAPLLKTCTSGTLEATTHAGRESQRESDIAHRKLADDLYGALKPRLVLAAEKKLSEGMGSGLCYGLRRS